MKLNLGAGRKGLLGSEWDDLDIKWGDQVFPLDRPTGSADVIRASHVLEHFGFKDAQLALVDWARVLKVGGVLKIAVPDLWKAVDAQRAGDPKALRYIMGGQSSANDYHKSVWTRESLIEALGAAGFDDIQPWTSEIGDCASFEVSLNLKGVKRNQPADARLRSYQQQRAKQHPPVLPSEGWIDPADYSETLTHKTQEALGPDPGQKKYIDISICAIASIPRLGWNDHWGCIFDALTPHGIGIRRFMGAFWHHGIQDALESCLRDEVDWVLSLDYDTMFTAADVGRLLQTMANHPEIDALAPLQLRRNNPIPLCTIKGSDKLEATGGPVVVDTAHFGCTIIRTAALKNIPKPWFLSVANEDGEFKGANHIDPDIYFWRKWKEHGKTVAVDPYCSVGHLELDVTGFDEDYEPTRMTVEEWLSRSGKEVREASC